MMTITPTSDERFDVSKAMEYLVHSYGGTRPAVIYCLLVLTLFGIPHPLNTKPHPILRNVLLSPVKVKGMCHVRLVFNLRSLLDGVQHRFNGFLTCFHAGVVCYNKIVIIAAGLFWYI